MYTIRKTYQFDAAHHLACYEGKCARMHGHTFTLHVVCKGESLIKSGPKEGMLIDFSDVSKHVKPLIERYLDHYLLNETLEMERPTAERLARWIFEKLKKELPLLHSIEIEETPSSSVIYEDL